MKWVNKLLFKRWVKIPELMKLTSLWVVWGVMATGALGWAMFVVLDHFGVEEQAGWAQVFGTVLAIIGAGAFPFWHERVKERQNRERTLELLRAISNHIRNDLRFMLDFLCCQAFNGGRGAEKQVEPSLVQEGRRLMRPGIPWDQLKDPSPAFLEFMQTKIHCYNDGGHGANWSVHRTILSDISVAHLWAAEHLHHLFHLKKAVEAGSLIAQELESICSSTEFYGARVRLLKHHHFQIEMDVGQLNRSRPNASTDQ